MGTVLSVVIAVAIPLGAGIGIGLGIQDEVKGWYKTLKKPSWNPPNWVFGPVWSALYTAMGVASWETGVENFHEIAMDHPGWAELCNQVFETYHAGLMQVWRKGGGFVPLALYATQLALNLAWSPIFFKKHELGFALADITALLGVLSATIVSFHSVSPTAAYLLVPYFGWSLYATGLTFAIYKKNPRHRGTLDHEEGPLKEGIDTTMGTAAHIGGKAQEYGAVAADKAQEYGSIAADKTKEAAAKAKESVPKLDLGGSSSEAKTA